MAQKPIRSIADVPLLQDALDGKRSIAPSPWTLLNACDATTGWSGSTLALDTTNKTEGTGSLKTTSTNASITAIKAKTDNLPADPADQSQVEAAITAAHVTTDAAIAALPTAAEIDAELSLSHGAGAWGGVGATRVGGSVASAEEWVLNDDTTYVVKISNSSGGSATVGYDLY